MFHDLARFIVSASMLVMVVPALLPAEELKLTPGLTIKEEFNDNVFLASGSRRADFITTLTPSLDFSSATERQSVDISTGVNWLDYSRNAALNSVDYFVQSGLNYRFDPRLSLSAGAGYVRDSRPDRSDLDSGLTLKTGSDRQNYQLSGSYAVSEKCRSTASYAYSQEQYDNPGLLTTTVHHFNIAQEYDLGHYMQQAKLVGSFSYNRDFTDVSQVDNYTGTAGLVKKIHELWRFSLNAGGRYTLSEFDVMNSDKQVTSKATSDGGGWVGNLLINYGADGTDANLSFKHDVTTASGRAGATERTGVSAYLSERFTSELSGFFGMGYSWNRSDQNQFSAQSINEKNLTINGGLRYDFSRYVSLEGNYRYNNIYYSQSSSRISQNTFILRLMMRRDVMGM